MSAQADILTTWQEIADYFGVSLKAVKRWDEDDPMPIKRPRPGVIITSRYMLQEWVNAPSGGFREYAKQHNKSGE